MRSGSSHRINSSSYTDDELMKAQARVNEIIEFLAPRPTFLDYFVSGLVLAAGISFGGFPGTDRFPLTLKDPVPESVRRDLTNELEQLQRTLRKLRARSDVGISTWRPVHTLVSTVMDSDPQEYSAAVSVASPPYYAVDRASDPEVVLSDENKIAQFRRF